MYLQITKDKQIMCTVEDKDHLTEHFKNNDIENPFEYIEITKELKSIIKELNQDIFHYKFIDGKFVESIDESFLELELKNLKEERNLLLQKTDYLLISDYPITAKDLAVVKKYRQALRDFKDKLPRAPKYLKDILA